MSVVNGNTKVEVPLVAAVEDLRIDVSNGVSPINGLPFYTPKPADITINNHKDGDKSKILFKNVNIFDSTGSDPYLGDVLIEGERIQAVGKVDISPDSDTLVIDGKGKKTLMSGLVDAHTHLSWNNSPTLDGLTRMPIEEHVLHTAKSAKTYLDCGYTMCFGAASAQPRLDLVIKQAIKSGMIPGPRTLSNCQEITTTGGAIIPSISRYADGADEMRRAVREFIELGVDNIKLSMTGDYVHETMGSEETYFTLSETKAAVEEAHNRGKRVCSHARSAASVKMSCLAGVDVIYHASYVDAEGMDMLEGLKDRLFVAPAINFPLASCQGEATPFGLTPEMAKKRGLVHEVDAANKAISEMRRRGIRVLPGGDYGFAWAPHGTYSKDLAHFVNLFGYSTKESLIAATALGGEIMGYPGDLGKVLPGYYADVILVDGNPVEDIEVLQDISKLHVIVINGHVHKNVN
ncbi:composite domain of metallo-dependent hydrolase [Annulohypoxylon maeteangense]|uniref:composite domain of metallo-dependent hydrolase n=1 Tax=Annulohypoxylon maeteangense TaxID=1927788 RepID=UPI0020079AB8|nr:composite domain of metallo-dependent hydrolase [Annulohypoxylon maeteangense]KAI0883741.1 composite domain of metallo-dependent hydrolase [Annulohypoxylon maeteangense]